MLTEEEATRLVGSTLVSSDGNEVGEIETVVAHAADNRAAWAVVSVGGRRVLVPLDQAHTEGDKLHARYGAQQISSAPEHDGDTLDADTAETFYEHYDIDDSVLRDHSGFVNEEKDRVQGTSRDPRGGSGANDATQGHP